MSPLPDLLVSFLLEREERRNSRFQLPATARARTLPGLPSDGGRLLRKERFMKMKAKFYARADAHALTHLHLAPQHLSLALHRWRGRRGGICLGKPKGDLACTLHWEPNEDSNESPLAWGHICSVTNFNSPSINWWRRRLTTPGKPVAGLCMDKERRGEGSSVGLK